MVSSILRARIHTPAMLPPDRPTAVPLPLAARAHDRCGVLLGAQQTAARQQGVAGGDEQAENQAGCAAEQILSGRHILSLPFVQPR